MRWFGVLSGMYKLPIPTFSVRRAVFCLSRIGVASDGNTFLFLLISCYNNTVELSAGDLAGSETQGSWRWIT